MCCVTAYVVAWDCLSVRLTYLQVGLSLGVGVLVRRLVEPLADGVLAHVDLACKHGNGGREGEMTKNRRVRELGGACMCQP